MKFRLNIIQIAGLLWCGFGCVALYFASHRMNMEMALRVYGKTVRAQVIGGGESFRITGTSGVHDRPLSASDAQDVRSGRIRLKTGQRLETTYTLAYRFEVPSQGSFQGKSESGWPFTEVADSVNVMYLPRDPKVNELENRVKLTAGNILFWSIGAVFWLLLFPGIGLGLFYLGIPVP